MQAGFMVLYTVFKLKSKQMCGGRMDAKPFHDSRLLIPCARWAQKNAPGL